MTDFEIDARVVEVDGTSSISLDTSATPADDSGIVADLAITAENTGDSQHTVSAGPPAPFGVLVASERGNPTNHFTLWSTDYSDSDHLTVDGRRIVTREKVELTTALDPGEPVSQEYQIYDGIAGLDDAEDSITPGTYVLQNADRNTFDIGGYGIELDVSE